jgi:uncharacterized repeat protein (TIGR01451 family)
MKNLLVILSIAFAGQPMFAQKAHHELRSGNAAYKDQNYTDAEAYYRKALEEQPSVKGNYNLANAMFQQGRYEEAIRRYNYVLSNTDDDKTKAAAYHNLGNTYFEDGQLEQSIEAYKSALRIAPNDASTRYNLAQAQRVFYEKATFDLALKLEAQERPPLEKLNIGDQIVYEIKVVNEGQIKAENVIIINYLQPGLQLEDPYWAEAGGILMYAGGLLNVPPGDSITIRQKVKVVDNSDPKLLMNAFEIGDADNRFKKKDVDSTPRNAFETPEEDDTAVDGDGDASQNKQKFDDQQEKNQQEQEQEQQQQQQDQQNQEQQQQEQQQQQQNEQQPSEEEAQQSQQNESGDPQEQQAGKAVQMTEEEARRLLEIIEAEELKVLQKSKKDAGKKKDKDW